MAKKRRLKSPSDIRRFLAYILNQMDDDEIPLQKGTKMAYVANILLKSLELTALEQRITTLEEKFNEKEAK